MLLAFIKNPVIAYRLQQITDSLLCTIMKKNVLAEQVVKLMFTRQFKRYIDPAILGRVQVAADGEEITTVKKLLQFSVAQC